MPGACAISSRVRSGRKLRPEDWALSVPARDADACREEYGYNYKSQEPGAFQSLVLANVKGTEDALEPYAEL